MSNFGGFLVYLVYTIFVMKYTLIIAAIFLISLKTYAQVKHELIPKIELQTKPKYNFGKINGDSFKPRNEVLNFDNAIQNYKVKKINKSFLLQKNKNTNNVIAKFNMPCLYPSNKIKNHILVFKPTEDITNTSNQMPNAFSLPPFLSLVK